MGIPSHSFHRLAAFPEDAARSLYTELPTRQRQKHRVIRTLLSHITLEYNLRIIPKNTSKILACTVGTGKIDSYH